MKPLREGDGAHSSLLKQPPTTLASPPSQFDCQFGSRGRSVSVETHWQWHPREYNPSSPRNVIPGAPPQMTLDLATTSTHLLVPTLVPRYPEVRNNFP